MSQPINLNKARKTRAKLEAKAQAAESRVRFGAPKAERQRIAAEAARAERAHKGHRRED